MIWVSMNVKSKGEFWSEEKKWKNLDGLLKMLHLFNFFFISFDVPMADLSEADFREDVGHSGLW